MTRLEGVIAFPAIFERFPDIHLVERPPTPSQLMFRGYDTLPVRLTNPGSTPPSDHGSR